MAKQSKKIKAKITLRVAPLFLILGRLTTNERFHLFDITYVLTHIIKPVYKCDVPSIPRVTLPVFRHLTHLADAFQSLFFVLFSPAAGGRRTVQTYPAGPTHLAPTNIATSGTPAHNKSDCTSARCDDKERTPNKPTKRRLTRPHSARSTEADAT